MVFIFDQFEEILTIDPTDRAAKTEFFAQVGDLLRQSNVSALFAMREEFPAGLDPYLRPIPTRLNTTFRLELLGVEAACQAMQAPAQQAGIPFTSVAANTLIDDLRTVRVQQADSTTEERLGLYIEPVQLQVVCYRLWEHLPDDATQIEETHLQAAGDVNTALAGYYADRVNTAAEQSGVRQRQIRAWFDTQLITEQGIRGQVLRGIEQSQGLENTAIAPLVDAHLVRAEHRRGATWYELAHDRLIEPIRADNAAWFQEHLSMAQRQAALWDEQHRPDALLFYDQSLDEAEQWAATHQADITPTEQEFLAACRKARLQAQQERRKNRFIQGLAIVALIISVVAGYFFFQARQSEKKAQEQTQKAEDARQKAEEQSKEADRRAGISLAQSLAAQAQRQQTIFREDERAALLARQADLFNQRYHGEVLSLVDDALRSVLSQPYFHTTLSGHEFAVQTVAFSPDGQTLASGSVDNTVRLWNLRDPAASPIILTGHKHTVRAVAFSPDGQTLASGSEDKTVQIWNLRDPAASPIILTGHKRTVRAVAFSPDGQTLASGSGDNTIRLWNLRDPAAAPVILTGHERAVYSVAFSPDGQTLASGGEDKTVRLWNVATALNAGLRDPVAAPVILNGHEGGVYAVAFSPDGQTLASGSKDKTVRLWNVSTSLNRGLTDPTAAPAILTGHEEIVTAVAFSYDGQTLVSGSYDKTVLLWNLRDPTAVPIILTGHKYGVMAVTFSPDGQTLASGSDDKTVRLWQLRDPVAAPTMLSGHEDGVWAVAFSPDGQTLASGSDDKTVRLWNLRDPAAAPVILSGHEGLVRAVAFSPDGQTLASGSFDNTVRLWNLHDPNAAPVILNGHEGMVHSLAFSPDGQTLASGSFDKTVRLWNVSTALNAGLTDPAAAPVILTGHEDRVRAVAFSPDGQTLASGSNDSTVRLWNLRDPTAAPAILTWYEDDVFAVAFSSDGQTLASGSNDSTVRLWLCSTAQLADSICQTVQRNLTFDEWRQLVSPTLPYERTCSNLPVHPTVLEIAQNLAKANKIDEAKAIFQLVTKLDPNITLDPATELIKWRAQGYIEEGQQFARAGKINQAMANFKNAMEIDPNITLDPASEANKWRAKGLVDDGVQFIQQRKFKDALTAYAEARKLDPVLEIPAQSWNNLCWSGSLNGAAADVLAACEQAIKLEPENGGYRDSRGLARALTGNIAGAIEDFQAFVNDPDNEEAKAQRQQWIEALKAEKNPFTPEVLKQLR